MASENSLWATMAGNGVGAGSRTSRFASPWSDVASQYAPRTFRDALTLCEHLYCNDGTYRAASEKVVNYFVTKLSYSGQADGEIEKFKHVFEQDFCALERLTETGYDFMAVGNGFASVIAPFTRVLKCKKCRFERNNGNADGASVGRMADYRDPLEYARSVNPAFHREGQSSFTKGAGKADGFNQGRRAPAMKPENAMGIDRIDFEFRSIDMSFHARCPFCRGVTPHTVYNYPNGNPKKIRLQRWDPKRITIEHDPISGESRYWLEIDPTVAAKVRRGDPFLLSTLPWEFVKAICQNQKFLFNPDYFFHLKQPTIAGVQLYGWGLPSILSSFRNFFRLQVLRRYNEVLAMDYILPLRLLSPSGLGGANGIESLASLGQYRQSLENAVHQHRRDGADYHFLPFPVQYQAVGGDGRAFSPADMIDKELQELLNARGVPMELYQGTLTTQVAPVGLRLFERNHVPLVSGLNRQARWMSGCVSRIMDSGDIATSLDEPQIADDLERRNAMMALMQSQMVSRETGLATLGVDGKEEKGRIMEELKQDQREERKAQSELEMEQMNLDTPEGDAQGTGGAGGAGGQGGGAGSMNPMDVQAQGQQLARDLVGKDEATRRQQLTAYREQNPTLHAVVLKELDKLRGQAGVLGRAAGLQAMAGGQAPPGQPAG
jgi:hypothetical protein